MVFKRVLPHMLILLFLTGQVMHPEAAAIPKFQVIAGTGTPPAKDVLKCYFTGGAWSNVPMNDSKTIECIMAAYTTMRQNYTVEEYASGGLRYPKFVIANESSTNIDRFAFYKDIQGNDCIYIKIYTVATPGSARANIMANGEYVVKLLTSATLDEERRFDRFVCRLITCLQELGSNYSDISFTYDGATNRLLDFSFYLW